MLAAPTLALGRLVACNQFEKNASANAETHALSISECAACNLVQLSEYPPLEYVRPRLPWIRYNEPSAHLDAVVERLNASFSADRIGSAMGVGPFDEPLIERMAQRGFTPMQLELSARLPREPARYPYLESIQAMLRSDVLAGLAAVQGTSQLVSCRYLLEHSHDPVGCLQGLGQLMAAGGMLLVEVPDSSKFLSRMDYSFIWEEHICYFTERTLRACVQKAGYDVVHFSRFPGALEDALVCVLRVASPLSVQTKSVGPDLENQDTFARYKTGFDDARQKYHSTLHAIAAKGQKVVIFGAGHQSIMFVNALGLAKQIAYAIDDAPEKIGYLLPGTAIPIVPSDALERDPSIGVCLLGVGPHIEQKIRSKCAGFLNRGGRMYTIFPGAGSTTFVE
jgi:hypothetical protein